MFLSSTAFAEGAQVAGQPSLVENLVPFIFVFIVFYFLFIRPQAKRAKEQAQLIKNLQIGDEVVTHGGIVGKIRSIAEEFVTIESGSSHLKIMKENVSRYTQTKGQQADTAKKSKKEG